MRATVILYSVTAKLPPPWQTVTKSPSRSRGERGAAASVFGTATQQSTHATSRPGGGLFPLRLTPLRRSGRLVSRLRRSSPSPPSSHRRPTRCVPLPRRRHPGGSRLGQDDEPIDCDA